MLEPVTIGRIVLYRYAYSTLYPAIVTKVVNSELGTVHLQVLTDAMPPQNILLRRDVQQGSNVSEWSFPVQAQAPAQVDKKLK